VAGYSVSIERRAQKALALLPDNVYTRIIKAIDGLTKDPRPPGAKALQGRHSYLRVRIGDYRVMYTVQDDARSVQVIYVGHRLDVYRN
jgi:mRNA interferase RelE/StbE